MGVFLTERAALDGEVLCERIDETTVDRAVARNDALAGQFLLLLPEVRAAMLHEQIELDEAALVKEQVETLARRQLPFGVLLLDALCAAALHDMLFFLEHLINFFLDCGHHIPPDVYMWNLRQCGGDESRSAGESPNEMICVEEPPQRSSCSQISRRTPFVAFG